MIQFLLPNLLFEPEIATDEISSEKIYINDRFDR